jgi:hypothetical protein
MKSKLKILTLFLQLSFISLSQIDTNKICFEYDIVQKISRDLVRYDSTLVELEYTKRIIEITENRSLLKDKQIEILISKNVNYSFIIEAYKEKETLYKKREDDLIKENASLTHKNKNLKTALITTSTTTAILGGILAIFILR